MTYNPLLPTIRDRVRLIAGDTSNDVAAELLPDATYDAMLALYLNWRRGAADIVEAVAVRIEQNPTGFTAVGDLSVSWSDRTRSLRGKAQQLRAEADAEDAALNVPVMRVVTVTTPYLSGYEEGSSW